MKKLVLILLILCLCGCNKSATNSFEELGYSQYDIEIINKLPEDIQVLFKNEYCEDYVELINTDGFNIDNFNKYITYLNDFDKYTLIHVVNNQIIDDNNKTSIIELYNNEYFIEKNEATYLQYLNTYSNVRECIENINTGRNDDYYTNIKQTDIEKNYLMLVNKYNCLASDYEPDDLVNIDAYYGKGKLRKEVYEAFKKMVDDANKEGLYFTICSGYRSYEYQEGLYNKYLNQENGDQSKVDVYSARPGHSEHQTGLCFDLWDNTYGMEQFDKSAAYPWIKENCYKYGFIIRYTENKENITGYQAEPWQLRYVGDSSIAKDIFDKGITFDEYYACYIE